MSLNIALMNAISGLQINQRALDVTAQNVSNVNTEGYSKKTIQQQAVVIAGQGVGVEIATIERTVNEFMVKELQGTLSEFGDAKVREEFFARMQNLFGTLSSDTSVGTALAEIAALFQAVADTPESVSIKTELIEQARLLVQQISDMGDSIEDLRAEVDKNIEDDVTLVNTRLSQIQELNIQIAEGIAQNFGVGELQDQRDLALNDIAERMDIQHFTRNNGEIVLLTPQGRSLVDRIAVSMTHAAVSTTSPTVTHSAGTIDGIDINGTDITGEIASGRIAGLVHLRDQSLPNLQSQLQELVTELTGQINALHNQGSSHPAQTGVTGSRTLASADAPVWTGTFRTAILDSNGVVAEVLDVDLSTTATVGALVTALDGMTNMSASQNSDGNLVLTPTGGNRVAFNEMTSAVTIGNDTLGASHFLGLNDFFTTNLDYDSYGSNNQSSNTAALGLSGTLTISGGFGSTGIAYTTGNSITDIAATINANGTLTAAGISATIVADGGGYRLDITDAGGQSVFMSDSGTLVSALDLKPRQMDAALQIGLRSDIAANPSLLSHATLSNSGVLAATDIGTSQGDKTAIQAMANKFNEQLSYSATNLLAASTSTFAQYAADILSLNAAQADAASDSAASRTLLVDNLKATTASISGVNLDEEMSLMITLENAYAASARVITTAQEMFDMLRDMVR